MPLVFAPRLQSVMSVLPRPQFSTEELLVAARGHLSERLEAMLAGLGVDNRHSMVANYPGVLFGGEYPKLDVRAVELAVAGGRGRTGRPGQG